MVRHRFAGVGVEDQVTRLLGDATAWRGPGPTYSVDEDLFTAVAAAFALHADRALQPAPLRGYVTVEERSTVLRGRLRIGEQLSRWPGRYLPLEITHDEYTLDVPENQLLRGATDLLLKLPVRSRLARSRLLRIRAELDTVSPTAPAPRIEAPPITRLNRGYASALALAVLILRGTSITTEVGTVRGISFVFDMNAVFEEFLTVALKHAIERHGGVLHPQRRCEHLDQERHINLIPDLTWQRNGRCRAVLDAKYKRLSNRRFPNADAYQMLAYCTALRIDRGYLVYAKDAAESTRDHTITNAGKTLHVRSIDVEQAPQAVLAQVSDLAAAVAMQASSAPGLRDASFAGASLRLHGVRPNGPRGPLSLT